MSRHLGNLWIVAVLLLPITVVSAGDIVGVVKAAPKPGSQQDVAGGKYDSRKYKFMERMNYDEIKDFVVYIDQSMPGVRPPTKPVQIVIQKDATFQPHVLPILVGTTVEWPNHDDIYHNVFSMSDAKPFDLGLYKNNEVKRITFDKPGRVDVFCSIHTKMNCIILVLQNPYYAVTDKKGGFRISGVPAGTYKVKAWYERLPAMEKEVTVPETGEVTADFTLTVSGLPEY